MFVWPTGQRTEHVLVLAINFQTPLLANGRQRGSSTPDNDGIANTFENKVKGKEARSWPISQSVA
jgi:hypothetical protein